MTYKQKQLNPVEYWEMKTIIKNLCAINFIATRWRMLAVDLTKYTKFKFIMIVSPEYLLHFPNYLLFHP